LLEVLAETVAGSRAELDSFVEATRMFIDCYDLPEAPLGSPAPSSLALAVYLAVRYGVCAVPHIRLHDVNALALLSQIKALDFLGVNRVLLTMGDKPSIGKPVGDLDTEAAVELVKKRGFGGRVAVIISLKYSMRDIARRLESSADDYYVIRAEPRNLNVLREVYGIAKSRGKRVYVYTLVATPKNAQLFDKLNQPHVKLGELPSFLSKIREYCDGVIISSPLDREAQIEALKIARNTA